MEDLLKIKKQVCFPLYVCSKEIIKKHKPYLDEINLTYTQYITMLVLWEHKEMNVKCLGKILYLDSGTLTPLLKKLEAKSYIKRQKNGKDERNLIISLTPKGKKLKEKAKDIPIKVGKCLELTDEEYITIKQILEKMIYKLEKDD